MCWLFRDLDDAKKLREQAMPQFLRIIEVAEEPDNAAVARIPGERILAAARALEEN